MSDVRGAQATVPGEFTATDGYRNYVVWLLFSVYALNFVDRQLLTLLIEPIKREFKFSDTELGLLGGLAFALLYSTLGIPIARVADRKSRVAIITISLFAWSVFTALTGLVRGFWGFLFARVAVGIGEAGCSPSAYSLISDYFPPSRRSTAISIYSMGISGGVFLGFLVGGQVAQHYGWRAAFYALGLPGIVLAVIVKLTLREPPRGFSDAIQPVGEAPPLDGVLGRLWSKRSFRHLSIAAALHAFVGYGVGGFNTSFLMRTHGMTIGEIGTWLAGISLTGGFIGTYLGGMLADRYTNRTNDPRYQLWIPGISTLIGAPFALLVYSLPDKHMSLWLMIPTGAIGAMYLGPSIATTQTLVGLRERALAGALLLFIINLIGMGLGPLLTGMLSDLLMHRFKDQGLSEAAATADGLRWALRIMIGVNFWSAAHYMRGARFLPADLATASLAAQAA